MCPDVGHGLTSQDFTCQYCSFGADSLFVTSAIRSCSRCLAPVSGERIRVQKARTLVAHYPPEVGATMLRSTFLRFSGRRLTGLAAGVTGLAAAAAHHSLAAADAAAPAAADAAPAEPEPEPETCMQILLQPPAQVEVLKRFAPTLPRALGERVWLRPCVAGAREDLPIRALAYAEDHFSQSLLIALDERVLSTTGDAVAGQGYPILPLALADDPAPPPPPPPASSAEKPETVKEPAAAGNAEKAEAEAEPEGPSVAEVVEGVWRELEAAGVVEITRDEDALPQSIRLTGGGAEWRGELGKPGQARPVRVVLIEPGEPGGLALTARSAKPECGFCRFMKVRPLPTLTILRPHATRPPSAPRTLSGQACPSPVARQPPGRGLFGLSPRRPSSAARQAGPCGKEFEAWEACIDKARPRRPRRPPAPAPAPRRRAARARATPPRRPRLRHACAPPAPASAASALSLAAVLALTEVPPPLPRRRAGARPGRRLCGAVRPSNHGAQDVHGQAPRVLRRACAAALRCRPAPPTCAAHRPPLASRPRRPWTRAHSRQSVAVAARRMRRPPQRRRLQPPPPRRVDECQFSPPAQKIHTSTTITVYSMTDRPPYDHHF